jgi:hypothetical protein
MTVALVDARLLNCAETHKALLPRKTDHTL